MDLGLQGKKALVCASSKGLGKAIAKSLAEEGAELFMCARDEATLKMAVEEIQPLCKQPIHYSPCDLASFEGREAFIRKVKAVFPALDILIHNVGGPKPSKVETTKLEDWQRGFDQNFQSIAHLNEAFLPGMKAQNWGRIVAVTSLSTFEPIMDLAVSNAIRPAVAAMLKTLADEVAARNITINCVAPGMIMTDRTEERIADYLEKNPGKTREEWLANYVKSIPAGRLGRAEEFGTVVTFLCSEQASYITGSSISVDGGKRRSYH